jgi:hypothetical protein
MKYFFSAVITVFVTCFQFVQGQTTMSPLAEKVNELITQQSAPPVFAPFFVFASSNSKYDSIVNDAVYLDVNLEQVNDIITNQYAFIEVEFPFEGKIFTAQLFPSVIFAADFELRTSSNLVVPYQSGAHYRGIIKGDNTSMVAISFFDDHVQAILSQRDGGNIVLSNLKNSFAHVMYREKNLLIQNPIQCATPDTEMEINITPEPMDGAEIDPCVRVFIEADFEMFEGEGGAVQTADQIVGFFNVSSTIYFNEGITDIISEIFVWDTDDPYPSTSSIDALEYFRDFRTTFDGDLAHLVTYDDENLGGVAYVPALCSDYTYAYSNIYDSYGDFPTYSWTVDVFTHEMGHNLGSPHTHNCSWPGGAIDNCYTTEGGCDAGAEPVDGGTIMSYCHLTGYGKNFALGFGPLPGGLIYDEVNDAGCLGGCELPPANDWPCAATTLPVNDNCIFIEGSNVGAINSTIPPVGCDGPSEGDIWFSVTIPAEGYVIIDTDNGPVVNNMGLKVYSGTCTEIGGYPDGCVADGSTYAPLMPGLTITGAPGTTYLLRLWEVGNDDFGAFSICAYTECAASMEADAVVASEETICAGETVTLTVSGGALGTDAEWFWYTGSCGGAAAGSGETITVNPTTSTTYYVQAIGECNTTVCITKTVTVEAIPTAPVIINANCNLSVENIADATYTWLVDGTEIVGENENTISVTEDGNYSVTVTTAAGCTASSALTAVDCQEIGIHNLNEDDIQIYPNPANGEFVIQFANVSGDAVVGIYDITGKLIDEKRAFIFEGNDRMSWEVECAAGMYFVMVEMSEGMGVRMLMVE